MKYNMKKFQLMLLSVVVLSASACSDWTETESVGIKDPSLEEQNPELNARYMEALRNYKNNDHKVVFITLANDTEAPNHRNEHLTCAPDSVDFISLTNPEFVHPELMKEISEVHEKGTKVIYNIDFSVIEKLWKEKLEQEEADKEPVAPVAEGEEGEGGETPEPEITEEERFLAFIAEQTLVQLSYCDQFGFDGVKFGYTGKSIVGITAQELALITARQEAYISTIKAWSGENGGKLIFFKGLPQNLVDRAILKDCKYIVIPAYEAASMDKLSYLIYNSLVADVPSDRFIAAVTMPSITDLTSEKGYFAGFDEDGKSRLYATKGVSTWTNISSAQYTKAGISILNAQNDYYGLKLVYKNVREAISIMNPAPKN